MSSDENKDVPYWTSCRYLLALIGLYCFTTVYMVRVNLSVAMVCMVAPANLTGNSDDNITDVGECPMANISDKELTSGTFLWDKSLQGTILSSFFYGYVVTQVPGGWMAERYGGKMIIMVGMTISLLCTVFTPLAASYEPATIGPYLLMAIRVVLGLATAVTFPSMHAIWGKWAPTYERTKLMAFCYAGTMVGNVVTMSGSGILCVNGFAGGWPSIFYVSAIFNFVLLLLWWFFVFDSPADHPRITAAEERYIERSIGDKVKHNTTGHIPWKAILTTPAVYAAIVAHFCSNWGNYTLQTSLPTYMKAVLKYDIKSSGLLSALPYICMFFASMIFGLIADALREKVKMSTTIVRKIFQSCGLLIPAGFMIGTAFVTCDIREVAVAFLTTGVAFTASSRAGYVVNHVDLAPRYAGILYGISNTVATIPGMIAPTLVGELTPNGSRAEWQVVFYIWSAVYTFGALFFLVFGSGEKQSWATDEPQPDQEKGDPVIKHQLTKL